MRNETQGLKTKNKTILNINVEPELAAIRQVYQY